MLAIDGKGYGGVSGLISCVGALVWPVTSAVHLLSRLNRSRVKASVCTYSIDTLGH